MAIQTPSIKSFSQNRQITGPFMQIVLLLIVVVLFSWFLVKPKFSQSLSGHSNLAQIRGEMNTIDSDQRQLDKLVNDLHSDADDVALTDEALPLTGRVTKLDVVIDTLARSSGMQLAQINSENTDTDISAGDKATLQDPFKDKRSLQTTAVSVLLTGTVDQFKNFLQLLETNGRILDVSNLEITGGDSVTKFRVKIKAYSYEPKS